MPIVWYTNDAGLTTKQLIDITIKAATIFSNNGYKGLSFIQVSIEEAKKHVETYEYQMFIAFIKSDELGIDPGRSIIKSNGRIGVYENGKWRSFVNMSHSQIANHKGDKNYAAGYITAHEVLHQIAAIVSYYTKDDAYVKNFHTSGGNLNTRGIDTDIPANAIPDVLPPAAVIPDHLRLILDAFFLNGERAKMQKCKNAKMQKCKNAKMQKKP